MKVYYLKGMSSNQDELDYLKMKFEEEGMELIPLVDNYANYSKMSKEEIKEDLINRLPKDEKINLVCHSMGCNYGLLAANNMNNIEHITFVSPEFEQVTSSDYETIVHSTIPMDHKPNKMKFGINKLKNIMAFVKSSKWSRLELHRFLITKDTPTLIFYSTGDEFVSRKQFEDMYEFDNISFQRFDTNNHNPLLENNKSVKLIKKDSTTVNTKGLVLN
jgi:hypothetical protein